MTGTAESSGQVCALALGALDATAQPMVRADPGQAALFMGIASACAEWLRVSHQQTGLGDSEAELAEALVAGVRELADRLAADAGAVIVEVNPN